MNDDLTTTSSSKRWLEIPNYRSREHWSELSKMLMTLRRERQFCDVMLIAGANPEERAEADFESNLSQIEIPAHRVILAAACPYFHAMFTTDMAEAHQRDIYIQGVSQKALDALVNYMYTSEIHITEENVLNILPAADLLQIHEIRQACCEFLKAHLLPSNCLWIRSVADLHSCVDLFTIATQYAEQHFNELMACDEFLNLKYEQLSKLISSDGLMVSNEEKVFESVISWVRFDLEHRKSVLAKLMEHVRLPLLNLAYLVEKVDPDPLIRESPECKDFLIEALKFHLMHDDQKTVFSSPRTKPRVPCSSRNDSPSILVIGGQAPKAIRSVDAYDVYSAKWFTLADMPMRRCRCGVAVLNGLVYAIGGFNGSLRVRNVDVYDPAKNTWTAGVNLDARRSTLGVAVLDGEIYAVGGFDGSSGLNSVEAFDPRVGEWRYITPMNTRRSSVGVAVLNDVLYAVGGYDGLSRHCLMTVERYDPRNCQWYFIQEMSSRRSGPGVAALNGKLYALGGHDGPIVKNSAEVYDPETKVWRPIADMTFARRNAGVCCLSDALYSVGGDDGSSNLNSVEIYNPSNDSWSLLPNAMGFGRSYAGVAVVSKTVYSA